MYKCFIGQQQSEVSRGHAYLKNGEGDRRQPKEDHGQGTQDSVEPGKTLWKQGKEFKNGEVTGNIFGRPISSEL